MRTKWVAPQKARISLHWGLRAKRGDGLYRPTDWDNSVASIKAAIDGLVMAGVILDDDWGHLEAGAITSSKADGPWLRLTVEPV